MALLTLAEYPAVRAALDVSLSADSLPDSVIGLDIYQGAAEAEVTRRDATATSANAAAVRAAIYLTAARLAPALPQLLSETFGDNRSYRVAAFDAETRAAELRALAEQEFAAWIVAEETPPRGLFVFTTAAGGRGA